MTESTVYLNDLLNVFTPETRFLKCFSLENGVGYAEFEVDSRFYSEDEEMKHFTAVQMQICLNQFLFVYIAAIGKYDKIFAKYGYDEEYIRNFQNNNTFLTRQVFHFCKIIETGNVIKATMSLISEKNIRKLNILNVAFDFENGNCKGEATIVVKTD